jgi:hypothetical protein
LTQSLVYIDSVKQQIERSFNKIGEHHACQINSHLPTQDRAPGQ